VSAKLAGMEHLYLIIPDLIPPRELEMGRQPELALLETMLSRATHVSLTGKATEDSLCGLFGVSSPASLRAAGDGLDVAGWQWMCADPVELQRQPTQVMVQPDVACTDEEATAFCDALTAHFAADGISFHAPHPQRWYLRAADVGEVAMPSLLSAAWSDARKLLPQGRDAVRWRALGNEIQMLLHGHVLNQARMTAGLPPVSGLWLWGGGATAEVDTILDAAGGDEPLPAFARAAGIRVSATLAGMLQNEVQHAAWLATDLGVPLRQHDLYRWRENLLTLQRDLMQPVWQMLKAGKLHRLTLEAPGELAMHRFEWVSSDGWKVWRRRQPLAAYSV